MLDAKKRFVNALSAISSCLRPRRDQACCQTMPLPDDAGPGVQPQPLRFHCISCGVLLTIKAGKAGTSGPCPMCGARITAPAAAGRPVRVPATAGQPVRRHKRTARTHKGAVLADTGIDHAHIQNRESLQSLKVLAFFLLTFCICLAVIWLLSR